MSLDVPQSSCSSTHSQLPLSIVTMSTFKASIIDANNDAFKRVERHIEPITQAQDGKNMSTTLTRVKDTVIPVIANWCTIFPKLRKELAAECDVVSKELASIATMILSHEGAMRTFMLSSKKLDKLYEDTTSITLDLEMANKFSIVYDKDINDLTIAIPKLQKACDDARDAQDAANTAIDAAPSARDGIPAFHALGLAEATFNKATADLDAARDKLNAAQRGKAAAQDDIARLKADLFRLDMAFDLLTATTEPVLPTQVSAFFGKVLNLIDAFYDAIQKEYEDLSK